MSRSAPPLAPLFRSDQQLRILAVLFGQDGEELPIGVLAEWVAVSCSDSAGRRMSPDEQDQWLTEALATRDLERVQPNMGAAGDRVNDARRHVRSARRLASDDPTLAIAACHDAIRKALTAHMAAAGLRPRSGEGAHRIVLNYARNCLAEVITGEDLTEAER